jgi:hypothetical protein
MSAVVLLHTPQRLNTRGLTLIGVLISLARGEGQVAMISFMMEACLQIQAEQAARRQGLLISFWYVEYMQSSNHHRSNSAWHAGSLL